MGKNKPVRNAFYYFMVEFKQKTPRRYDDMKAVADAAGPIWSKMTLEERKPYEEKAKAEKQNQKVVKYTTIGVKIDDIQKREEERNQKEQLMKEEIEDIIRIATEGGSIADEMFYLIHINHFCYCNATKQYIPAELAVARFTLRDGVTPDNVYHIITKPGPLPLGYSYLAKKTSDETHQLEPPLGEDAENNLADVMTGLMGFIKEIKSNSGIPRIYVQDKNKEIVESVLKNLCINSGYSEDLFKVYSAEYMFYRLRNAVNDGSKPVYPAPSISTLELERDKYDFCKDIACSYHEISDVPNHCSRSHVIRLAYSICDNCCGDLDIELIPGQHVPREANVTNTRSHSRASGYGSSVSSVSTVKKTPTSNSEVRHVQKENNYFLSQQTESGSSVMSETSSICDPNDYAAVGAYGYDSAFSQADTDEWLLPKQRNRRHDKQVLSQSSVNSSQATSDLYFTLPSGFSVSGNSQPTVSRRPTKLSAGLTGEMSQLSLSPSLGSTKNTLPIGRGRGRGIAANFTHKMT